MNTHNHPLQNVDHPRDAPVFSTALASEQPQALAALETGARPGGAPFPSRGLGDEPNARPGRTP